MLDAFFLMGISTPTTSLCYILVSPLTNSNLYMKNTITVSIVRRNDKALLTFMFIIRITYTFLKILSSANFYTENYIKKNKEKRMMKPFYDYENISKYIRILS